MVNCNKMENKTNHGCEILRCEWHYDWLNIERIAFLHSLYRMLWLMCMLNVSNKWEAEAERWKI